MSAERFKQLMTLAGAEEQAELTLAHNGRVNAMRAYNAKPGKQTREDFEAARQLYDDTLARMVAKYLPEEAPAPEGERFANRKQALNWLQAQGYKVSQGKFYQDVKAGFPLLHRDGSVSRYQVMQYGQQLDVESRAVAPGLLAGASEADEARKLKAQADQEEMKAERMRREHDADWLHADEAWAAVAALVGTLRDSLRHHFHTGQGELIHLAGGDPGRGPEVYEGCEEIMARAFNEVCNAGQIAGIFEQDSQEEAA